MSDLFAMGQAVLASQPFSQLLGAELTKFSPEGTELRLADPRRTQAAVRFRSWRRPLLLGSDRKRQKHRSQHNRAELMLPIVNSPPAFRIAAKRMPQPHAHKPNAGDIEQDRDHPKSGFRP